MTTDELRAFCDTGSERRVVQAPFSLDAWTYATDGSIIVRVPRLPEVAELPNRLLTPPELFANNPPGPLWYPVPTLPPAPMAVPCSRCGGKAKPVCPACHDTGEVSFEFWHGATRYTADVTCPVCHGEVRCGRCDGTLIERRDEEPPVELGPALFAPKYIRLLAALPHCEMAPSNASDVCRVRFDGGDGLVMPMRRYW